MVGLRCGLTATALLAASLAIPAFAGTSRVPAEAVGHGKTVTEATDDALARAVAQVNGADVSTDSFNLRSESSATYRDNRGNAASVDAQSSVQSGARFESRGQVASYKVLATAKQGEGYEVRVRAEVFRYDIPAENEKRHRMAILPLTFTRSSYELFGPVSGQILAHEVGVAMEAALIRGGRFTMLDRASLGSSLSELSLVGSDFTGPAEKAKLQRIKGADYIVQAGLRDVGVPSGARAVNPATGQPSNKFRFEVQIRVIVPASGEVTFTDVVAVEKKAKNRDETVREVANALVGALSDRLYPSRVVGFNGGQVIISGAGASFAVGERIAFYAEGEDMKDPYSGESLGRTEKFAAEGAVSKIQGKMVYVSLRDGRPAVGMLARREGGRMKTSSLAAGEPQPMLDGDEQDPSAQPGIRLPFDR